MAASAKTFRIFVSSTFSDLKAERNALQVYVFPRLRELCAHYGARFQPIDLRWGVSSEASLDQQAMNICLGEIERCQKVTPRPNFIVLLGDRYGWMPPPAQIPDDEKQQIWAFVSDQDRERLTDWYSLDKNAVPPEWRLKPREKGGLYDRYQDWQPVESRLQRILAAAVDHLEFSDERRSVYQASATHQEINAGAFQQGAAPEHVFCFFRHIQDLPESFSMPAFQAILSARLKREYPRGLSPSCQELVRAVQALRPDKSAIDAYHHIKGALEKASKATDEEAVLQFMHQVLVDFCAKDFINLDEDTWRVDDGAYRRLEALKSRLQAEFNHNLFSAQASWKGGDLPSSSEGYRLITEDHIGTLPAQLKECEPLLVEGYQPINLCEAIFRYIAQIILAEIEHPHEVPVEKDVPEQIQKHETLDDEGLAHHKFAEERLAFFVGRTDILEAIADYFLDSKQCILTIAGAGGTGKSALIAKAIERAQRAHPVAQIVYRFIGVTPESSDGRGLLDGLCRELSRRYGVDESDIPIDFRDLTPELSKRMGLASVDRPLILFLDSLDQLSGRQGARSLTWLPAQLPEHVSLVVSTRGGEDTYENLKFKQVIEKHLGGLEPEEGQNLLDQWLNNKSVKRTLQPAQREEVLKKFSQSDCNPLYLKLAFEEACLWPSGDGQPPERLEPGITGIIQDNMIHRLAYEGNHGEMLISHALGYLAASRYGLAEDELVDLLSRDLEVYEWFFRQTYHLPSDLLQLAVEYLRKHPEFVKDLPGDLYQDAERLALGWLKQYRTPPESVASFLKEVLSRADGPRLPIVLWSRLSFDLAPYLTERLVHGSFLSAFYHRELEDVSKTVFLSAFLFELSPDFANELDMGRLSVQLLSTFEQHQRSLSTQAQIIVDQTGSRWMIVDGNDQYLIQKTHKNKLAVLLMGGNAHPYHKKLADYFRFKADPKSNQSWTGNDQHSLVELPYHQYHGRLFDELINTINDCKFIDQSIMSFSQSVMLDHLELGLAAARKNTDILSGIRTLTAWGYSVSRHQVIEQIQLLLDEGRTEESLRLACNIEPPSQACAVLTRLANQALDNQVTSDADSILQVLLTAGLPVDAGDLGNYFRMIDRFISLGRWEALGCIKSQDPELTTTYLLIFLVGTQQFSERLFEEIIRFADCIQDAYWKCVGLWVLCCRAMRAQIRNISKGVDAFKRAMAAVHPKQEQLELQEMLSRSYRWLAQTGLSPLDFSIQIEINQIGESYNNSVASSEILINDRQYGQFEFIPEGPVIHKNLEKLDLETALRRALGIMVDTASPDFYHTTGDISQKFSDKLMMAIESDEAFTTKIFWTSLLTKSKHSFNPPEGGLFELSDMSNEQRIELLSSLARLGREEELFRLLENWSANTNGSIEQASVFKIVRNIENWPNAGKYLELASQSMRNKLSQPGPDARVILELIQGLIDFDMVDEALSWILYLLNDIAPKMSFSVTGTPVIEPARQIVYLILNQLVSSTPTSNLEQLRTSALEHARQYADQYPELTKAIRQEYNTQALPLAYLGDRILAFWIENIGWQQADPSAALEFFSKMLVLGFVNDDRERFRSWFFWLLFLASNPSRGQIELWTAGIKSAVTFPQLHERSMLQVLGIRGESKWSHLDSLRNIASRMDERVLQRMPSIQAELCDAVLRGFKELPEQAEGMVTVAEACMHMGQESQANLYAMTADALMPGYQTLAQRRINVARIMVEKELINLNHWPDDTTRAEVYWKILKKNKQKGNASNLLDLTIWLREFPSAWKDILWSLCGTPAAGENMEILCNSLLKDIDQFSKM